MTTSNLAANAFAGLDTNGSSNRVSSAKPTANGYHAGSTFDYTHQQPQPQPQPHAHNQYNHPLSSNRAVGAASITSPIPPHSASNYHHNGFPPSVLPTSAHDSLAFVPTTTAFPAHPPPNSNNYYTHHSPPHSLQAVPRSSYLSPTQTGRRNSPPILPPDVNGASLLYRSVSADSAPPHSTNHHLVQRLAQQNALIREAWEAERNYLEANRRRAEEVYQEERVIMEEVREGWENEKATMLLEIQALKERIQRLEGENHTLKAVTAQSVQISGVVSPQASQQGDSIASSANISAASASGVSVPNGHPTLHSLPPQGILPESDPLSLPPGLDGASRRPHFAKVGSSRTSPIGQPDSSPFIPLDPRMQPQVSNPKDFLSSPSAEENDMPVPVIDVHELDPKLDGIPLKATAVQKFTFAANESNNASPATSPPPAAEKEPLDQARPNPIKRLSSKDHTIQVLRAEESRRLTMHAGHTPNHSLSLFPTMSIAASSTGPVQDDETPEKTLDSAPSAPEPKSEADDEPEPVAEDADVVIPGEEAQEGHPEEVMDPEDDVKLKGPLMIKNIPAQDEIFWDQVNKKLEPISLGQDALPTVMRTSLGDEDAPGAPKGLEGFRAQVAPVGGDASHDAGAGGDEAEAEVSGQKGVEGEIPLKLRSTTNFGAPFGMA